LASIAAPVFAELEAFSANRAAVHPERARRGDGGARRVVRGAGGPGAPAPRTAGRAVIGKARNAIAIIVEGRVVADVVSDDPALIGKTVRIIDYDIEDADQAALYIIPHAGGHDVATVREETIVRTAIGEPVPMPPPAPAVIPKRLSDAWKTFIADAMAKPPHARSASEQEEIRWAVKHA
jgi:hypothetical protein